MALKDLLQKDLSFGKVKFAEVLLLTKHLHVSLRSGLTLIEALRILEDQSKGVLKTVLRKVIRKVESGSQLHKALADHPKSFSQVYINLIKTGELSGSLEINLSNLARELAKNYEMTKKVKSALMYPALILIAAFVLIVAVVLFVFPKIIPLFSAIDVELPLSTRIILAIANIATNHRELLILGIFAFVTVIYLIFRSKTLRPFFHRAVLSVPIAGKIVRNLNLNRFSGILGTLLESAIPLDRSLDITADATKNIMYQRAIKSAAVTVREGRQLASGLEKHSKLFPPLTHRMISMSEQTGNMPEMLKYLSEYYQDEANSSLKDLTNALEPVMLIFIGLTVGGVAISILGPIYKITGNLKK